MKNQPETQRLPVADPACLNFHYTESEHASMEAQRNGSVPQFFTEEDKYFRSDEYDELSSYSRIQKNDML